MPEGKRIIHIRIRDLRRQRALTQEELAAALGISRQSVNAMEAGRALPSLPVAMQIASFFSVPLAAVFGVSEDSSQSESQVPSALVPWIPLQEAFDEYMAEKQAITTGTPPALNLYHDAESVTAEFFVPGYAKEQLDTEVGEDFIKIRGLTGRSSANYVHQEVRLGSFERTVSLAIPIRPAQAKADLKNGVLTIKVPKLKQEHLKVAHIEINSEE